LTQRETNSPDDATNRAASLIAQALGELQRSTASEVGKARQDLLSSREILQNLASGMERHLAEEKEQHLVLASQLTNLAGSLDRLVGHLQGLSQLMADLLERLAEPAAITPPESTRGEPPFQPGGEGVSLTLTGVPGFQALMEIQKALTSLDQVDHASVERFQEGDSRILVALRAPVTGSALVDSLISLTGQVMAVEEAQPELARLRVKVIPVS
jgi:hypothetical protein